MSRTELLKQHVKHSALNFAFSLVATLVLGSFFVPHLVRSEKAEVNLVIAIMLYVIGPIFSTLPKLLSLFEGVKTNETYLWCTWFLLPFAYAIAVLAAVLSVGFHENYVREALHAFLSLSVFLLLHSWSYYLFQKSEGPEKVSFQEQS